MLGPGAVVDSEQVRAAAYLAVGATVIALGRELVGRMAPRSDAELEWIAAQAGHRVEGQQAEGEDHDQVEDQHQR